MIFCFLDNLSFDCTHRDTEECNKFDVLQDGSGKSRFIGRNCNNKIHQLERPLRCGSRIFVRGPKRASDENLGHRIEGREGAGGPRAPPPPGSAPVGHYKTVDSLSFSWSDLSSSLVCSVNPLMQPMTAKEDIPQYHFSELFVPGISSSLRMSLITLI